MWNTANRWKSYDIVRGGIDEKKQPNRRIAGNAEEARQTGNGEGKDNRRAPSRIQSEKKGRWDLPLLRPETCGSLDTPDALRSLASGYNGQLVGEGISPTSRRAHARRLFGLIAGTFGVGVEGGIGKPIATLHVI